MATGNAARSVSAATDRRHRFTLLAAKFEAKWSRDWVIPGNVLQPADAEAELLVDSEIPKNRPAVTIKVRTAWNGMPVPELDLSPLKLNAAKVVDPAGIRPTHKFSFDNEIWNNIVIERP